LCDGPVGVPNAVIVGWLSFCTFGPGAPTALMISGAKIAVRIRSRDHAKGDERHPVLTESPPEQLQRRARRDVANGGNDDVDGTSASTSSSGAPILTSSADFLAGYLHPPDRPPSG
jgi:hypothetical protein